MKISAYCVLEINETGEYGDKVYYVGLNAKPNTLFLGSYVAEITFKDLLSLISDSKHRKTVAEHLYKLGCQQHNDREKEKIIREIYDDINLSGVLE